MAFVLQPRRSFDDGEGSPSATYDEASHAYSSLALVLPVKEMRDMDELVITDTQDPHEEYMKGGQYGKSTSMWVNAVANCCSSK